MEQSVVDDLLRSLRDASDYRFFFDCDRYLNFRGWRTDDFHYALCRFLRDGDRRNLVTAFLSGGTPLNHALLEGARGRRLGPQRILPRPSDPLEQYQGEEQDVDVAANGGGHRVLDDSEI